jgi:hypothetical protein
LSEGAGSSRILSNAVLLMMGLVTSVILTG